MYKYKELKFYQRAEVLSNDVFDLTMTFPKFETYDLGSQISQEPRFLGCVPPLS